MEQFNVQVGKALWKNPRVVIIGDLNINCLGDEARVNNPLLQLCDLYDMSLLIKEPTRVTCTTSTLIDIILTTMPEAHTSSCILLVT